MSQKSNHKPSVPLNRAAADLWDDTLLIKKYDESLMLAKEEVAKRIAQTTNTDDGDSEADRTEPTGACTPAAPDVPVTYGVGDFVRCTFSEDGIDYEAEILSVKGELCWVRYAGYNNEESVDMSSLIPSWGAEVRDEQIRSSAGASTSAVAAPTPTTTQPLDEAKPKKTKQNTQQKSFDRYRAAMMIPPPPPLPPMQSGDGDSESEHLSSMLMAWYMSGYYTGLYQGQKMAKQSKEE